MDVAVWLRELGLEQYEQAFRDNAIDAEVLPKLTADDLRDIGVAAVGHRRKLLEAIAALDAASNAARDEAAEGTQPQPRADVAPPAEGERRQLTVLFCDLVGSTELSARLDPEDMGTLFRRYHATCAEVVGRWGGHVAKYMGDGVLAYFGYPRAHEDDAERAVRAGLDLVQSVGGLEGIDDALAARTGIATGLVMVGEGAAQEQTVVGDTPNLAARLQALAEPSAVVIGEATRRLVGGLFELEDLGPQRLKGFSEPLAVWRVRAAARSESRFDALRGQQLTPMIGREHELGLLIDRWERAKDGEGQVVLLSGEPGIGKSRIVRALRERLADDRYVALNHYCSAHHQNTPLHPVIGLLERAAGFSHSDPPQARLDKLEALLARGTERLEGAVPLLADLLSVPTEGRWPPLDLTPQRQRQKTVEVLLEQVERLAAAEPVMVVYEDVHWSDPSTLEVLELLVERVRQLPVLVLNTFRPEFSLPWAGSAHVTQLSLSRLTRRHGEAMVERITAGKPVPADLVVQIVTRTDGIPLFVEELTKTVLESGLLRDAGDRYELSGSLPTLAIPATLHDSLMARLDRLAPVKEVAQIGAVIGREFSHELLAAVAPMPEADLDAALDQLVGSQLIYRRGVPPAAEYVFKHALIQDVARQSLLKARQKQLHAKIASALVGRFPAITDTQPEFVAYHFSEAGMVEEAIEYWHQAGERATSRSANLEAIAHLTKGVELLRSLPEGATRNEREYALQIGIGAPLVTVRGYGAQDVEAAYSKALELSRRTGRADDVFPALRGLWNWHLVRADLSRASELGSELLRFAKSQRHDLHLVAAHRAMGTVLFLMGRFTAAGQEFEQGVALYEAAEHRSYVRLYGEDPGVVCQVYVAWIDDLLGRRDRGIHRLNDAFALAQRLEHPYSLAFALAHVMMLHSLRGEFEETLENAESGSQLCTEHGFAQWLADATIHRGYALAAQGKLDQGIALMRQGLLSCRATGSQVVTPLYRGWLADVCLGAGRYDEGLAMLADAFAHLERTEEHAWTSELHRMRGKSLMAVPDSNPAAAEGRFRKAIAIAQGQDAKLWELRAATSLARLWTEQGERQKAHDLLAPVYGWFTEGFDTADLKEAKSLLDGLA